MEHYEYYELLGEKIFFAGITSQRILEIAKYKPGKSFKDVDDAVSQGRLEGFGKAEREFACIAQKLSEVVEINTTKSLQEYTDALYRP